MHNVDSSKSKPEIRIPLRFLRMPKNILPKIKASQTNKTTSKGSCKMCTTNQIIAACLAQHQSSLAILADVACSSSLELTVYITRTTRAIKALWYHVISRFSWKAQHVTMPIPWITRVSLERVWPFCMWRHTKSIPQLHRENPAKQ